MISKFTIHPQDVVIWHLEYEKFIKHNGYMESIISDGEKARGSAFHFYKDCQQIVDGAEIEEMLFQLDHEYKRMQRPGM